MRRERCVRIATPLSGHSDTISFYRFGLIAVFCGSGPFGTKVSLYVPSAFGQSLLREREMKRRAFLRIRRAALLGLFLSATNFSPAVGENPTFSAVQPSNQRAIAAGEFVVAKSIDTAHRDQWLGQIAIAQSRSGESAAAVSTVRQIESPQHRQTAMDEAGGVGQKGGGAFADFDSLMNLIETTVVPDTWEALGGNSTMAPYPQGVYVDPEGTVQVVREAMSGQTRRNLELILNASTQDPAHDWRSPSAMRCISLRRLRDEIAERRMTGQPLGDSLLNLAGLSRIQYMMITEDDILIAAPVGGIDVDQGWFVDRETGRTTIRSDFLTRCFAATLSGTPFGCTIDPTAEGMQAAATVASHIRDHQIPIGLAASQLRDALGMQRIEVFGTAGDTSVGLLMVEADRHMKQLALGQHPMPDGVNNYLDVVDQMIDQGPPDGLLLRLWFTANQQSVRSDPQHRIFEMAGSPIQLSGQNQRALADGQRGAVTIDPRSEQFVQNFNRNWNRIRDQYPVYASLESLYRAAAVTELIDRFAKDQVHRDLAESLAMDDESRDWMIVAPKQVESIATMHTVRKGKKRHHILMASGGVAVDTQSTITSEIKAYPSLASSGNIAGQPPVVIDQWWWNAPR